MLNLQEDTLNIQIKEFKEKVLETFGTSIFIYVRKETNLNFELSMMAECTIAAIKKHHPEFDHITSLTARRRPREYLVYVQALAYIAYKDGQSKTAIGRFLKRTHATIINSITMVENGLETNDTKILVAIDNILKEIENVGTVPENLKREVKSKPSVDPIWNEARHFIASNFKK